jgi:competence protein ComEC
VFTFVLLVGLDASVVRSALMGSIVILSKILHKQSSGVHILFMVATLMLFHNPYVLFDAGFHLSFLATYSLLVLPKQEKFPEYLVTIVWVFLFVSLYTMYLSQSTSFVGIFTNISVLIFVPIFMGVAGVSLLLSVFNIQLILDVFILETFSRYIFFVAQIAQLVPRIEYNISPQICVGIYVLLLSLIVFIQNRYTTKDFIEKHYQKFVPQKPS